MEKKLSGPICPGMTTIKIQNFVPNIDQNGLFKHFFDFDCHISFFFLRTLWYLVLLVIPSLFLVGDIANSLVLSVQERGHLTSKMLFQSSIIVDCLTM